MIKNKKRLAAVFAVLFFIFGMTFLFSNCRSIENRVSGRSCRAIQAADLIFYNWEETADGNWVSKPDPQIIMTGVDAYINNINLDGEWTGGSDTVTVYYTDRRQEEFSSEKSLHPVVRRNAGRTEIIVRRHAADIRIDLTEEAGTLLEISGLELNPNEFSIGSGDWMLCILMCAGALAAWHYRKLFRSLKRQAEMIRTLVKNDLKSRYAGSFFGLVWAFAQPLMTILVFLFVFEFGFRTAPVNDIRFILWFIPAYIPWVYFQDAVTGTAGCLREYSYLVKKIKFPVQILPVIKIISSCVIHGFFVLFMFVVFTACRYPVSMSVLQLLYYIPAMTFLLLGLGWLLSAAAVFMKDFMQIINILLQLGFFMIPIFWNVTDMNGHVLTVLKLNPVFYIVQGYRDSLLNGMFFWDRPVYTVYFWIVSGLIFMAGEKLFFRSEKHFADLI